MEEEKLERSELPLAGGDCRPSTSDLDFSFTSTTSTSSFATTTSSSSARSSLSLNLPSFSASASLIDPLPHSRSNSATHWSAIRTAASLSRDNTLHLRHLHLLRHLGSGHLARVFHCRIKGASPHSSDFALKVVDLDAADAAKLSHVRTEAQVLAALDHPFLPTLYARIDASHYSCFLIDYCPGGDLHSLLLRHPGHRLPPSAVRFFAAEVLLALEYLHSRGFVYRDLKPENVLIRADGHIMLSDFDLCFSADVTPWVHRGEVVAEPVGAYSRECVGTHEYLAPEIASGEGHGNGVDWWAFGVFVYELFYGRTPFKGASKEATLKNITSKDLKFSENGCDSSDEKARDLIRRLLVKEPRERMGSRRGAAEIKKHPFFEGVRWQMMRCQVAPVAVGPEGAVVVSGGRMKNRGGGWWSRMVSIKCKNKFVGGGKDKKSSKKRVNRQKAMKL